MSDNEDRWMDAQDDLTWLSRWIDEAPANKARDPEAAMLMRFMKIGEEFGEVVAELIGLTGQNPRKGVTSTMDKAVKEALDTTVTALGAVESATGNQCLAFGLLFAHLAGLVKRAKESETQRAACWPPVP